MRLSQLKKGARAEITKVGVGAASEEMIARLLEMGILEGSIVELVHEAPFGGDPVAVRVRGTLIALRRQEAHEVEVVIYE